MSKLICLFLLLSPWRVWSQVVSSGQGTSAMDALQKRVAELENRVHTVEGAPAPVRMSAFNPAIGMAIDAIFRDHNDHSNFNLRAAELNLEAPIDPFLKGWAVITGSQGGVDVEEAAMQTTALPWSLQATGGRFFAPFGRFSQWHDHELPMVDRPNSLLTNVGGESQADGIQIDYLIPVPFYLGFTGALSNKLGTNNNRTDNATFQNFNRWTYLGRLHGYADLSENVGLDLGLSEAWTPKSSYGGPNGALALNDSWRTLSGVDLTIRYQPASGGLYHGVVWGTEVVQNQERGSDPWTLAPMNRMHSYSGYSNIETKLGRRLRVGGFADLTELPSSSHYLSKTFAVYLTFEFTEFNRLRIQYSRILSNFPGELTSLPGTNFGQNDLIGLQRGHLVMVQWTTVLGYHVHGFRGRWGT